MPLKLSPSLPGRHRLPFPAAPNLRAAQVICGKLFDGVEVFPIERWRDLEQFQPRVLVGPGPELQSLAELMDKRGITFPSLDHAVFLVTQLGEAPASDVQRLVLWQSFAVPVYELLLGPTNKVLAQECEAHNGWHIQRGVTFSLSSGELIADGLGCRHQPTSLTGVIESAPCPCNRPGQRILNIREYYGQIPSRRQLAASA